jgi:hypothetical protein
MAALYAVERRWRKPPPAPYRNDWNTVWVNFNNKADAEACREEYASDPNESPFEYRVVEQERVYGVAT